MSQDSYKDARKEAEKLLRREGAAAVSPDRDSVKKKILERMRASGEGADRVEGSGAINSAAYLADLAEEDFEAGTGVNMTAEDMIRSFAEKNGLQWKSIKEFDLKNEKKVKRLIAYIPAATAREQRIFPVQETAQKIGRPVLTVAIADPLEVHIEDDLRLMLPDFEIELVVSPEGEIADAINRHYGIGEEDLDQVIDLLGEDMSAKTEKVGTGNEVEINVADLESSPVVIRIVNLLLLQAVKERASDLHIEPFSGQLRIRYRVDGVLREIHSPPKDITPGILARLKVMAGLNIAENRRPQDGRIRLTIEGSEVDLRVACVPTVHGESIVMRVLDKSAMMLGVSQLGMQQEVLEPFLKRAQKPNGIVLVTGPTGSGKTTSLYATLKEVFDPGMKFITTEDPVEFELPGIVQVNINSKVGLTFAACLRSILRQDPDVILVGEIRDVETAQIAIQAALTGHLVLSTIHTNSAAATVTRLIDMGIEPFLLTSTLEAIVGQRLVRTVCPSCRTHYTPTDQELEDFGVTREEVEGAEFAVGRGCPDCNFSGYKGRMGVFEVLEVTDSMRELILQRATTDDLHAMAVHEGMITLRQDGWLKVCLGMTTFDEVNRHTIPETEDSAKAEMESVKRSLDKIASAQKARSDEESRPSPGEGGGNDMINVTPGKQ